MKFETKPCAAFDCDERIKRRLLMCPHHWRMVSRDVQDRVIIALDNWQSARGPAKAYIAAVAQAQLDVAIKEDLSPSIIAAFAADVKRHEEAAK